MLPSQNDYLNPLMSTKQLLVANSSLKFFSLSKTVAIKQTHIQARFWYKTPTLHKPMKVKWVVMPFLLTLMSSSTESVNFSRNYQYLMN